MQMVLLKFAFDAMDSGIPFKFILGLYKSTICWFLKYPDAALTALVQAVRKLWQEKMILKLNLEGSFVFLSIVVVLRDAAKLGKSVFNAESIQKCGF